MGKSYPEKQCEANGKSLEKGSEAPPFHDWLCLKLLFHVFLSPSRTMKAPDARRNFSRGR